MEIEEDPTILSKGRYRLLNKKHFTFSLETKTEEI